LLVAPLCARATSNYLVVSNCTTNAVEVIFLSPTVEFCVPPWQILKLENFTTNQVNDASCFVGYQSNGIWHSTSSVNKYWPYSSEMISVTYSGSGVTYYNGPLANLDSVPASVTWTSIDYSSPWVLGFGTGLTLLGFGWVMRIMRQHLGQE